MKFLAKPWPSFVCAALLAVLFLAHLYFLDMRVSTIEPLTEVVRHGAETVESRDYRTPPPLNLATGLVAGLFIGGAIGALCNKKFKLRFRPRRMGAMVAIPLGIIGGFLVMLGSMIAGEAPIGQMAGAMQLAWGAWIYLGCAFITAMLMVTFFVNSRMQKNTPKEGEKEV